VRLTRAEARQLALPVLIALALLAGSAVLIRTADQSVKAAQRSLAATQAERKQNVDRLARIAEEEREVKEKLDIYARLKQLNVIGEERRLEWADTITRIRAQRELLDVRYRVEKQRLLTSAAGKPANVDFFASAMKVDLALLHEEDLLRFLGDLRASGNAYYSVKRCVLSRTGQAVSGAAVMTPRLQAQCEIDLVTVMDRAAKR
jgi:hypothetical protein